MKILIVDDSATARMMINRCVSIAFQGKAEIIEAGDGNEAIQQIEAHKPHFVLSDINMPNCNGFEFLEKIRANVNYRRLPIMMVSSTVNEAIIKKLGGLGANLIVQKPITPPKILQSVQALKNQGAFK